MFHIWKVSPQYVCSYDASNLFSEQNMIGTSRIWKVSLQYEFSDDASKLLSEGNMIRTSRIWKVSPQYEFECGLQVKHFPETGLHKCHICGI